MIQGGFWGGEPTERRRSADGRARNPGPPKSTQIKENHQSKKPSMTRPLLHARRASAVADIYYKFPIAPCGPDIKEVHVDPTRFTP